MQRARNYHPCVSLYCSYVDVAIALDKVLFSAERYLGTSKKYLECMFSWRNKKNEPAHDKTYKMTRAPSEDSDQPGHLPSLISLFCALNG